MHSEPHFSLKSGTVISERYEILSPIMQDESSELYRVKHLITKAMYSLKILRGDAVIDKTMIRRLQWEARVLGGFAHKALPSVQDVGIHGSAPYLLMDLIEGTSLEDLVQKEGPLGVDRFKEVFRRVADAMGYVHDLNIVHTDIKPEFILIDRDSDGRTKIKIIGFCWSRGSDTPESLTFEGQLTGSPYYMSPEQCQGMPPDRRSDVYTLGATMYYALSGAPPFPGANIVETMSRHISDQPPQIDDDKSSPLYALQQMVVDKCLEKDPDNRFQSMKEVGKALVGSEPVHKPSASLRGTEKKKKGWWPF